MADGYISGKVEDANGAVENAVVAAVLQEDPANLSQSNTSELQALAKLTDVNGEYKFTSSELFSGSNEYHVLTHKNDGTQKRGQENYPYVTAEPQFAIPDSVIERTQDDSTIKTSDARGVQINPKTDFGAIKAELSSLQSGLTTAYVYDLSDESLISQTDISGLGAGDTFTIDANFVSGGNYSLVCDAGSSEYTFGYLGGSAYDSFTSTDFDSSNPIESGTNDSLGGYGNIVRWGGF